MPSGKILDLFPDMYWFIL